MEAGVTMEEIDKIKGILEKLVQQEHMPTAGKKVKKGITTRGLTLHQNKLRKIIPKVKKHVEETSICGSIILFWK